MKKYAVIFVLILSLSTVLPIITVKPAKRNGEKISVINTNVLAKKEKSGAENAYFKIKLSKTGKIEKIKVYDYLFGCIAAEMPITYEKEALKAQGVAALTYALRKKENSNTDYDITDNYKTDQSYIGREEIKKKWGENYGEYSKKLDGIINEIINQKITYNGETALTVYHAISNGKTLSAKEVWGEEIPYLVPVDSSFDKLSKSYKTVVKIDAKQFKTDFSADSLKGIKAVKNPSGMTKCLTVSGKKTESSKIRNKYDLCSSCFDVSVKEAQVIFTVYGYGHGVGMSQNGAQYMAQNGSDYREILLHYYKGCKIEKIKN